MNTPFYGRAAWAVGAPLGLWCTMLLFSINPFLQRQIIYAHNVVPWWQDTNQPQQWGFARNQVTPFFLTTEDGERIHAWHILPLSAYRRNEKTLCREPTGLVANVTAANPFRILKENKEAKVIIYFHGNAGHLPTLNRAPSFHRLADTRNYHVLAIDYRGFGRSSGSPSEDGLIRDATAAVDFVLNTAGVDPSRVVLLGHSLGTAVAAAVAEKYARLHAVDFAGVVLVAPFSSLPTMLSHYAIGGWIPLLKPLRSWPCVLNWLLGFIVDPWPSTARLRRLVQTVSRHSNDHPRHLRLSLIHAADDKDIPSTEDDKLFAAAMGPLLGRDNITASELTAAKEAHTTRFDENAFITEWREGGVLVRQERFPYGGHNEIMLYSPVMRDVMAAFDEAQ